MRIRLIFRVQSHSEVEPYLFQTSLAPPRRGFFPFTTSLLVHAAVLFAAVALPRVLEEFDENDVSLPAHQVQFVNLRVPDPLYYRASQPPAPKPLRARAAVSRASAGHRALAAAASVKAAAKPRIGIPEDLELPPALRTPDAAALVLQPEPRAEIPPPPKVLPPLAFWARQDVAAPKPPPKPFIAPGRAEAPTPSPQLDAPPVLAVPNREVSAGDLNISAQLAQVPPPLPAPNAATAPVRLREHGTDAKPGAIDRLPGDAANVIAISPARVSPGEILAIPKGLRSIPARGDGNGSPGAAGGTLAHSPGADRDHSPTANDGHSAPGESGHDRTASAAAKPAAAHQQEERPGTPGGADSADAAHPPQTGAGKAAPNLSAANGAPPSSGAHSAADAVTRILHPAGGNFDVVITQSTSRDDLADVGALLSGDPVYTVYVAVGDSREWVMEYCVPTAQHRQSNPYEIFAADPAPIAPPYPISTAVPTGILGEPRKKKIVFHGFLTTAGVFRNIQPRDQNPVALKIASLLSEWRLRPAFKDRVPTEVEILLVVPARI